VIFDEQIEFFENLLFLVIGSQCSVYQIKAQKDSYSCLKNCSFAALLNKPAVKSSFKQIIESKSDCSG